MARKLFYFENYVYFNTVMPNKVLLYNTLNHVILTYKSRDIYVFINELESDYNNRVVEVDLEYLSNKNTELYNFFLDVRANYMGDLLPVTENKQKPILFRFNPIVLKEGHLYYDIGEYILHNITEMTFYINEYCSANCDFCDTYYKQFSCCHKCSDNKEITLDAIIFCLDSLQEASLLNVNIIGGNILCYSDFNLLVNKLNMYSFRKIYKINVKNIEEMSDLHYILNNPNNTLELICTDLFDIKKTRFVYDELKSSNVFTNILVQSSNDLKQVDMFFENNIILSPFYNGNNILFFKENVFISKDELTYVSLNDIKRNYILNNHFFGSFICLPDGRIYSSLNTDCLGTIMQDSIVSMTFKEMNGANCWLQVRRNVAPCKNCLYSCLCPPISNYEKAIGRNNLCTIF